MPITYQLIQDNLTFDTALSPQPTRAQLLLFFGDMAAQSQNSIRKILCRHVQRRHQNAMLYAFFASPKYAQNDIPCFPVEISEVPASFGHTASVFQNENVANKLEGFLQSLFHNALSQSIDVQSHSAIDVYCFISNDTGACEIWPRVLETLNSVRGSSTLINIRLMWMYRERNPFDRDAHMSRVMNYIAVVLKKNENTITAPEEWRRIAGNFEAHDVRSLCLFSDRDESGAISNIENTTAEGPSVWKKSLVSAAGFVLIHLLGNHIDSDGELACAMQDLVFPDVFWMLKIAMQYLERLRQYFENEGFQSREIFAQHFSMQTALQTICIGQQVEYQKLLDKIESLLPTIKDIEQIPLQRDPKEKINVSSIHDAIAILYEKRFEQFFEDAVVGTQCIEFQNEICSQLHEMLDQICLLHGPTAAIKSIDQESVFRAYLCNVKNELRQFAHEKELRITPVEKVFGVRIGKLQHKLTESVAGAKLSKAKNEAAKNLINHLLHFLDKSVEDLSEEKRALYTAMDTLKKQILEIMQSYSGMDYYQKVQEADLSDIFNITEVQLSHQNNIGSHYRMISEADRSEKLWHVLHQFIRVQTNLNKLHQSFIKHNINMELSLQNALNEQAKIPVLSNVSTTKTTYYVSPQNALWNSDPNVRILLKIVKAAASDQTLIMDIQHLKNIEKRIKKEVLDGVFNANEGKSKTQNDALSMNMQFHPADTDEPSSFLAEAKEKSTKIKFSWPENANGIKIILRGRDYKGKEITKCISCTYREYKSGEIIHNEVLLGRYDMQIVNDADEVLAYGKLECAKPCLTIYPHNDLYVIHSPVQLGDLFYNEVLRLLKTNERSNTVIYQLPKEPILDPLYLYGMHLKQNEHIRLVFTDDKWEHYFAIA